MIKTSERYSDGSIKYLHDCIKCYTKECVIGTKSKKKTLCKSCLKIQRQENIKKHKISTKHGLRFHPSYERWKNMKARCYNPNNPRYKDWGERGIIVCDLWKNNAKEYIDYISLLDNNHKNGYSIDRINNDGNYEPDNMKWSTNSEQTLNQRHKPTNTGYDRIGKETIGNYTRYRIHPIGSSKSLSFKTLGKALLYRKEHFGF